MSLKKNIAYSSILTGSLYIFQFLTYPYVARVLGVTNVGVCNYVQSIVQFFCLFSMMGINTLGVREIAKCNGNKIKLCETYTRLLCLNLLFTFVVSCIYIVCIETIEKFHPYRTMMYISLFQLIFGTFAIEWFFKGIEEFKYITIRTLIIRILYVISVFVFVQDETDTQKYWLICCLIFVANGLININYSRRFVKIKRVAIKSIFKYLVPFVFLGTQLILTSFYTTFNKIFLGYTCGEAEIGYYTTATKIESVILALYTSFTVVMMPRISSLIESNDKERVQKLIRQSIELLLAFSIPCIYFVEFYAEYIVLLISGVGFEGAITPMRIVIPLVLIIGIEQIFIVQILIPFRADKQVFINSIIGASVGLSLNFILVPFFQSIGSSIVWVAGELSVLLSACFFIKKYMPDIALVNDLFRYLVAFSALIAIYCLISQSEIGFMFKTALGGIATLLYTHLILFYVIKNSSYIMIVKSIRRK